MNIYKEYILDHYHNPRNFGIISDYDLSATVTNSTCGDQLTVKIKTSKTDQKWFAEKINFAGSGCVISIASASMLSEALTGLSLTEIRKYSAADLIKLIGISLSPARIRCATLALEALHSALEVDVAVE